MKNIKIVENLASDKEKLNQEISKKIIGQHSIVDYLFTGLLCSGHILLEGVPGLAKTFARTTGSTGDIRTGTHGNYPTNSMVDKKLIDNPYVTSATSAFLVVKFNPADSSHFLGNVGKQCQLRTTGSTAGAAQSSPTTYNVTTTAPSSSFYNLSGTDRNGSVSGNNAGVGLYVGDTINFNLSISLIF